jgi:hypothetical protein
VKEYAEASDEIRRGAVGSLTGKATAQKQARKTAEEEALEIGDESVAVGSHLESRRIDRPRGQT